MANITRIKTNQITDGTVTAAKIASGTLVGGLFSPDLSLNSNVTILGNLSVTGNNSIINSVNTYIQDPTVVFNNGYSGSLSGYTIGVVVNRNYAALSSYGAVNTAWVWVENDQAFEAIATTTSGNAITTLNTVGFANLKVGNINAAGITTAGTITAGAFVGPISTTTGSFTTIYATNLSTGNALITGGSITGLTNLQSTNAGVTTLVATNLSTANAVIAGGYISGLANASATTAQFTTLFAPSLNATAGNVTTLVSTNFSTANAQITGGSITGLTNLQSTNAGVTTLVATNLSSANLVVTNGFATTLVVTNFSTANAVISGGYISSVANIQSPIAGFGTATTVSLNTTSGNIINLGSTTGVVTNFSTANAQITGGAVNGLTSLSATTTTATNFSTANAQITGGAVNGLTAIGSTSGVITNFSSANLNATSGSIGTLIATTGFSTANAFITNAGHTTAVSTNFSSGNAVISGGYISGLANIAATGVATVGNVITTNGIFWPNGQSYGSGVIFSNANVVAQLAAYSGQFGGTVYITNMSTANAVITGGYFTNLSNIAATGAATVGNIVTTNGVFWPNGQSYGSGSIFSNANVVAQLAAYSGQFGGTIYVTNLSTANTLITGGSINGLTTLGATSGVVTNFSSSNLVATSGSIGTLIATTGFSTANATVTNLGGTTAVFTNLSSGNIQGTFNGTVVATVATANVSIYDSVTALTTNQTFYPMFSNISTTGNTINSVNSSLTFNPSTGVLSATNFTGTGSFSTAVVTNFSTANAQITGGAVNGLATLGATSGVVTNFSSANLNATSGSIGTLIATTGFSTANAVITGGSLNNTPVGATTASTGAFTTLTNSGVHTSNGNLVAASNTPSTNATTGALVVKGGVGITGDLNLAGNLSVTGTLTYINTTTEIVTGTEVVAGNLVANSGTVSTSVSTGALVVAGGTGISGAAYVGGPLVIQGAIQNTGPATGALQVSNGGAYINGNLWIGGNLNLSPTGNVNTFTGNSGVFYGNAAGFGALYAGVTGYTPQAQTTIQVTSNFNGYAQLNQQNINPGAQASSDFIATANNGNANDTYIDMGMASSAYSYPGFGLLKPNDGYLLVYGNTTTNGGNLVLGAGGGGLDNDIIFAVGGFDNVNEFGRIDGTGNVFVIKSPVAATNTTSGAIQVAGGIGVQGAIYGGSVFDAGNRVLSTSTGAGNLSISGTAVTLPVTGPGATTIGSTSAIPVITTDAYGRVTALSTAALSTSWTLSGTSGTATINNGSTLTFAGTYGVTITAGTEYANIATPQDLRTTASPTFTGLLATNFSTGNALITGGAVNGLTTLSATTGVVTNFSTANALVTGGAVNGLTTLSATTTTATNFSSANLNATSGSIGTLIATTGFSTANATITNLGTTTLVSTNFSTANAQITGGTISGLVSIGATTANFGTTNTTILNATTGNITNVGTSNLLATSGSVGTLIATTGFSTANAQIIGGNASVTNFGAVTGVITNFSSGNAQITGGSISGILTFGATTANFGTTNTSVLNATTGNITNIGTSNIVATIGSVGTLIATTGFSTANATATNFGTTTAVATNFSSGNARISAGYADNFAIGANTAATGRFTTLTATGISTIAGNVVFTSATATNNSSTGAFLITGAGGAAIGGNINVVGQAFIGSGSQSTVLTSPLIVARGTSSTGPGVQFTQEALINTTNTGSTDYIAYGNNYPGPSADHGWMDMGFTGDAFSDPAFTITKSNDGYLFASGANATVGGNLVIATDFTGSYNDIVVAVGSFYANAEVARFHGNTINNGYLNVAYTTNASPANNTGALRVQGSASFSGNVYIDDAVMINGSKIAGNDFIVKGATNNSLIWARPNATYDTVIIGNSATASTVVNGAKLNINTTDSILLPVGTNAQRPSSTGYTDVAGMLRYSTTGGAIEWYNGSTWATASTSFTVVVDNQFNGDGVSVAFTITQAATTASSIVSINGIVQIPTLAYSVSGTTLTFTEAPVAGDVIDVRLLTTTTTITNLTSATGKAQITVDDTTGVTFTSGVGAMSVFNMPLGGGIASVDSGVSVATANTPTTVDTIVNATYRTAKYIIQVTNGSNYQSAEALVIQNGTTATVTTYGVVQTGGNLGVLSATVSGSNTLVQFTAANATNTVKLFKQYVPV